MTTTKARTTTLAWRDIDVGDEVTPLEIPVTTTVIVAGAIASRDYMPVHHDRDFAKKQGSPDVFMNILTSNGLCVRFLTDWLAGDVYYRTDRPGQNRDRARAQLGLLASMPRPLSPL